jgi:MFS family permease
VTVQYPKQFRNLVAFGTDYVAFNIAMALLNINTVLPAFASRLGGSTTLVGLLITILLLGWNLPQLPAGNLAARQRRKKPMLVTVSLIGRPVVLIVGIVIALTRATPAWLSLLVIFIGMSFFVVADSFATVAWLDILGRAIPPEKRGRYISIWQVVKAAGVFGASQLVRYILSENGPSFPYNYALLFIGGGLALGASTAAITAIYEPPPSQGETTNGQIAWHDFGKHIIHIWQGDSRLRHITLARLLFALSTMAFPFYVLYATTELRLPARTIGTFVLAQTIGTLLASLFLGRVADQRGPRLVIQIGTALVLTAPLLALAVIATQGNGTSLPSLLSRAYVWVYVCMGLAENLLMLGFVNYMLEISPPDQRTIYMGAGNAIASLGVLGPTFAGWLLGRTTYGVLFVISLLFGIAALVTALRMQNSRRSAGPAEGTS